MKKLLALAASFLLLACSSGNLAEPIKLDYSSWGKLYIDTQDLRIVDRTKNTPQWPPYVGHLFRPTVVEAVNKLAADRLQAGKGIGHATLTIKDATVTEQPLATASDFEHMFERQQGSKYIARVEVILDAQAPNGTVASADAFATRNVTLPEDPSSDEKYDAYRKLLTGLMNDLNKNLEDSVRAHMGSFLVNGGDGPAPTVQNFAPAAPRQDSMMPPRMMR